jgi:hypothetical protein
MNSNKFQIYAPAYYKLQKSGDPKVPSKIRIGGIITTEDIDADGEIVLTKGLDLSYFGGGWGKIKFEHDSELLKEPDNIIGFPDEIRKSNRSIYFEGDLINFEGIPEAELTPQQRTAKSAYGLLKAVEEYNRTNPKIPQQVGYSIEGDILQRSQKGKGGLVSKAIITNVVLTTKPKNRGTVATLVKSLQVGYGTSPETQTGFGATRLESIEGQNYSPKRGNKMFNSKEEAKKAFLSQGKSEEEAEKLATEWETSQKMDKSLLAKESFQKSISLAKEVEKISLETPVEELNRKLEKSVRTMRDGENVDLTGYFNAKQELDLSILGISTALAEKQDLLAKSLVALSEGLSHIATENSTLKKSLDVIHQGNMVNGQLMIKGFGMKDNNPNFAPSDLLKSIQYEDNNKNFDGGEVDLTKLSKSIVSDAIESLVTEGKATSTDVSAFEGMRYIDENLVPLVKAKVISMRK